MIIDIEIKNDRVILPGDPGDTVIVSGGRNYYVLSGMFSSDWDDLSKYVVMRVNQVTPWYGFAMTQGGDPQLYTVTIPEALTFRAGRLDFGFIGKNEGEARISTALRHLRIVPRRARDRRGSPLPRR